MPPSRPFSAEELIDVLRRVADSSLQQSAAINRQTAAVERLLAPFEQLRHDIYDVKTDRETDQAKIDLAIARVSTDIARLLDGIMRAQTDVRELQRDVTGAHLLAPAPRDERTTIERVIDRAESAKTSTKVLLVVLMFAFGLGGFGHLIYSLFTGG